MGDPGPHRDDHALNDIAVDHIEQAVDRLTQAVIRPFNARGQRLEAIQPNARESDIGAVQRIARNNLRLHNLFMRGEAPIPGLGNGPNPLGPNLFDPNLFDGLVGEPFEWHLEDPENHGGNDAAVANDRPSNSNAHRRHCQICFDDLTNAVCIGIDCGHHWCNDCFTRSFTLAMESEYHYPPKCCNTSIATVMGGTDDSNKILGADFVQTYLKKEVEYQTPGQLRRYCANPSCSAFLPEASKQDSTITKAACSNCSSKTCTACKQLLPTEEDHHDCKPHAATIENLGYSTDNRCKRCPCCSTFVQLTDACNHITCGICKHEFCFICLGEWRCPNNCPTWGDPQYDAEGYDAQGYHRDTGFNREGYDRQGFDVRGYNREGGRRAIRGPRRLQPFGRVEGLRGGRRRRQPMLDLVQMEQRLVERQLQLNAMRRDLDLAGERLGLDRLGRHRGGEHGGDVPVAVHDDEQVVVGRGGDVQAADVPPENNPLWLDEEMLEEDRVMRGVLNLNGAVALAQARRSSRASTPA